MQKSIGDIQDILIVGGGTAGWLTATILASRFHNRPGPKINIKLVEAPGIPIVGVGEGTWPSMRTVLHNAGIKESEFLTFCTASFKQASKFVGWRTGDKDDFYYHPFELPENFETENSAAYWSALETNESFSKLFCVQETICEQHLSPKLKTSREYAGATNYGYHLDAGKFSEFLRHHCTQKMGVEFTLDRVVSVLAHENGNISSVETESSGILEADVFIDCTGFRSLLLGQHLGADFIDKSDVFPINAAVSVRLPYQEDAPVKSPTISTAQEAGWIWDIGLSHRRGVGYVYSDKYISNENAQKQLQDYLGLEDTDMEALSPKRLSFRPGYRKEFWKKNCIGIGLSAGFLEPLEATAMMLIESSADMLSEILQAGEGSLETASDRFNARCHDRWDRIIDFLKLHYILSERPEPFWREAASLKTASSPLQHNLKSWKSMGPWRDSFRGMDDVFPAASYQYVLYGMGFQPQLSEQKSAVTKESPAKELVGGVRDKAKLLSQKLVTNREMLELIKQ